jgi:hypothetical protein
MVMRIEQTGRVAVAFHDDSNPTDAEWNAWTTMCRTVQVRYQAEAAILVHTLGGAPHVRQRAELARVLAGAPVRSAVLTGSAITRGVVTAIAWLGVPVRAFRPDAWEEILAYLRLETEEAQDVAKVLQRLSSRQQEASAAHS